MSNVSNLIPTTFQLYLSGFRPHISVWLEGDELQYNAEDETSIQKAIVPSAEQWLDFWRACDELDIWSWHLEYILNRWEEGYIWGVEIEYGDRRISTCGISAYPGKKDLSKVLGSDSSLKAQVDTWSAFAKAVENLLGGLPFMWSDWRPYEFPTHEQVIRNELGDDLKSLSDKPRDGYIDDLKVTIVDLDLSWFQLRIELPRMCVFADTDDTMTPGVLIDINHAMDMLSRAPETVYVDFDDESLDTARLIMASDKEGTTRLTIIDWCDEEAPPRLDILVPTATIIGRFTEAVANYAAITNIALTDLVPSCYRI